MKHEKAMIKAFIKSIFLNSEGSLGKEQAANHAACQSILTTPIL
jgi:hypothetical protein